MPRAGNAAVAAMASAVASVTMLTMKGRGAGFGPVGNTEKNWVTNYHHNPLIIS